jgi:hypothetical protein
MSEGRFNCSRLAEFENDMRIVGEQRRTRLSDGSKTRLSPEGLTLLKKCSEFVEGGEFDKRIANYKQQNSHFAPSSKDGKAVRSFVQSHERFADRCRKLAIDFDLPVVETV